jgi:hypothetical protein
VSVPLAVMTRESGALSEGAMGRMPLLAMAVQANIIQGIDILMGQAFPGQDSGKGRSRMVTS